jgi:putative ABC transport system permease protein
MLLKASFTALASENIAMALVSVWTNRFRSALTILGIVVGITTVVTVGSLTSGLKEGIETFFLEFGPDNIFVQRVSKDPNAPLTPKENKRRPVSPEYAALIRQFVPGVMDVSAQLYISARTAGLITARVPGFESENVLLVGQSGNTFQLQPNEMLMGRVFTPQEDARSQRVCVVGKLVAEALFPDGKPLGRSITVAGGEYTVIGVFAKAKGGFFGQNGLDQQIAIPLTTARHRFPNEDRFALVAKAWPGRRDDAEEEIRQLLRRIRHTPRGAEDDFGITTPDQIVKQLDKILDVVVLVSIALSSLGLLVGGIGVMNIMLVSVTERTKEIGIRKALGARRRDIVLQFLMEAVTLTGVGGLLGVAIATALTLLIGALVPALPSKVPLWAVGMGFGVAVSIGLFFGVWPAVKAASLDPVDALRYE